jgi:hypothetical protein
MRRSHVVTASWRKFGALHERDMRQETQPALWAAWNAGHFFTEYELSLAALPTATASDLNIRVPGAGFTMGFFSHLLSRFRVMSKCSHNQRGQGRGGHDQDEQNH